MSPVEHKLRLAYKPHEELYFLHLMHVYCVFLSLGRHTSQCFLLLPAAILNDENTLFRNLSNNSLTHVK